MLLVVVKNLSFLLGWASTWGRKMNLLSSWSWGRCTLGGLRGTSHLHFHFPTIIATWQLVRPPVALTPIWMAAARENPLRSPSLSLGLCCCRDFSMLNVWAKEVGEFIYYLNYIFFSIFPKKPTLIFALIDFKKIKGNYKEYPLA